MDLKRVFNRGGVFFFFKKNFLKKFLVCFLSKRSYVNLLCLLDEIGPIRK